RFVQGPYPVVLRDRECPERAIEGTSGGRHQRLLHQELEIHLPYPGHLVEEDKCPFEKRIDLLVLGSKDGRVELGNVLHPEPEILGKKNVPSQSKEMWAIPVPWGEESYHLPQLVR